MRVEKMAYEAPRVEVAEIAVEQGIAATGNTIESLSRNDEMGWE